MKKETVRKVYVEKKEFTWGPAQEASFNAIKEAIANNAMARSDPEMQFHLAVDTNQIAIDGVLFQLHSTSAGTEATTKFGDREWINLFLFYQLADAETRYGNSEQECLAIVRCLGEVKWLVMGSPYPIIVYSDHAVLKNIFIEGDSEKARINSWLDRVGEFDLKLVYRPSTDQHIGITDGLSRIPTRMLTVSKDRLEERMSMVLMKAESHLMEILENKGSVSRHQKYKESALYMDVVDYLERRLLSLEGLPRNR